jgi:hypothetical protein
MGLFNEGDNYLDIFLFPGLTNTSILKDKVKSLEIYNSLSNTFNCR